MEMRPPESLDQDSDTAQQEFELNLPKIQGAMNATFMETTSNLPHSFEESVNTKSTVDQQAMH